MKTKQNTIRIIGGIHRSRLIQVLDVDGLRPTASRVRETIFNWLQLTIAGARCLDLFAGSGALGIEALSRGARHVTFIEHNPRCYDMLKQNINNIIKNSSDFEIYQQNALELLKKVQTPYDIIFIDPPYGLTLYPEIMAIFSCNPALQQTRALIIEHAAAPIDDSILTGYFKRFRTIHTKESVITYYKNLM